MRAVILIFLIALTITATSTPFVRRFAIYVGFVDAPASRKLHKEPMPLLGGVAIIAGALLATIALYIVEIPSFQASSVRGAVIASTIVGITGLIDDQRELPPWVKTGGILLGVIVLLLFDIRVKLPIPEILNYIITVVWVVGLSNAINFLDNMDGLSAGVSSVAAAFIMLIGSMNGQYLVSGLAAALFGAALGFLRYNFKPAKIFMGDVGALFLGFLLAVLALQLRFRDNVNFVTWMVPVFIMAIPIFDMSLVVFSRIRRGDSPLTAGKDHISHRINRLGFTQRETVLILYLAGGVAGLIALFVMQSEILEGYLIGGFCVLLGMWGIWWLDNQPTSHGPIAAPSDKTEG